MKTSKSILSLTSMIIISLTVLNSSQAGNRTLSENNSNMFTYRNINKIHVSANINKATTTPFAGKLVFLSEDDNTLIFSGTKRMKGDMELMKFNALYQSGYNKTLSQWNWPLLLKFDKNTKKSPLGKRYLFITDREQKDIYIIHQLVNGKWTYPEKLNKNINSKYTETSACLSPDGNTLYFTSNRPGGYGGMDIYKSEKLQTGEWGIAQNLGSQVNTELDEESPFMLADGCTMYFSSKGHGGRGGFDVFSSTLSDDGYWFHSENAGKEINTKDDDLFFYLSDDGKRAFFSTVSSEGYKEMTIHSICL